MNKYLCIINRPSINSRQCHAGDDGRGLRSRTREDVRYQQESLNLLNLLYTLAEDQARKGVRQLFNY